jgi:hypothetical protein
MDMDIEESSESSQGYQTPPVNSEFNPFERPIPGSCVREKLQWLFLEGILKDGHDWRKHRCREEIFPIALKCLYAAMIGFNENSLSYLFPSGRMDGANLQLSKVQNSTGPSVRDRCCGHVFDKGETYYRCKYHPLPYSC